MVGSEAAPYSKSGGLGDVVAALPRALVRLGHDVDVVIPGYRDVPASIPAGDIGVFVDGRRVHVTVHAVTERGVRIFLVDAPEYFRREHLYGTATADYPDNALRFTLLARAALQWGAEQGQAYDVVHGHDWQAGLTPLLIERTFRQVDVFRRAGTVFTIHNLAYQGVFDAAWLPRLGLDADLMHGDALEYWGRISFLKAGIVYSRLITTVSPTYAREIQTPELGFGFDGILQPRSADLIGILNGIDYDEWDPALDPYLPVPYDIDQLDGKAAAKRALLDSFGLPSDAGGRERPLVGMISRMVDQKGFDLLAESAGTLTRLEASFVLLGTGEPRYEQLWRDLAARYPERIGVRIGFDEGLAHRIEGGADIFLMPSHFEPCGLNQMYSLRYGTVPVVRATGGLIDTVRDVDGPAGEGTGFTFTEYSAPALLNALARALRTYRDRAAWRRIQSTGMRQDFSWDASARQYAAAYERATME